MLLPHQVVPFLEHDDEDVRAHAARYLAGAHDPSPATAEDFWKSIDRFGVRDSITLLSHLRDMPQTGRSLDRLLETLHSKPDEETDYHLQRAIERLDFPLLASGKDDVLGAEVILPHVRDHLRHRLELADVGPEELWDRLLKASDDAEGKALSEFDHRAVDRLVEALARHLEPAAARAMERLRDGPADLMEVFCVQVLGEMRHAPATELLIQKLLVDDADVLNEEAVRALARVGTVEVVERLRALYPAQEWGVKLFVYNPLGQIKRPESERALLHMLEGEEEDDLRGGIAGELCELCTTEGLEQLRRLIVEDRYDPQMIDLPQDLLTVGKMVGYEPPEAAEWRAEIERRERERKRRGAAGGLEEMVRDLRDRFRRGEFGWSDPGRVDDEHNSPGGSGATGWPPEDYGAPLAPPPGTIRRDEPKVGRNDPCPCGSGRKYKKCCLKAAQA